MIENILWIVSFITLYIALVWLNFLYLGILEKKKKVSSYPSIDIAVPAYNEEKGVKDTLASLIKLDYPKNKRRIVVVNDGSSDRTKQIVQKFIKQYPNENIILINKKNAGKAAALNTVLEVSTAKLFACVDADSVVDKHSLKNMLHHLGNKKTAAVISALKVKEPKTIFERVQRLEYILAVLSRKIRSSINTLAMTPGVLSVYKTNVLKKIKGFDEKNITEDFEIAMRLKYHGYNVKVETGSFTYTTVPATFATLLRQRVRWFRGYVYNHVKYKDMFFNKKHGFMAYFQLPLNVISVPLLLITIGIITYGAVIHLYEVIVRTMFINGYILKMFYLPNFKELILGHNIKIMFPIYIAFLTGMYMFYVAHKQVNEKLKNPVSIWAYFVILPYLSAMYWVSALGQEVLKIKRKW